MALVTVKELLSFDCGSLVAYQLDKSSQLDSISFQTILMRNVFMRHPEVVFIHRTHNPRGKALYMFMVDKPFLRLDGEMTKVIHFAVPMKESAEGLAHMYRTFKAFNPEWKRIKTFLVDPHFRLLPTLSEAFPSAEVQLSVFHVCKHLQQKIHQMSLESYTEKLILNALRNTMCAPTESNLQKMHTILNDFVKPSLLPQLHTHWLLNEKIWATHRWRNWAACSQYFKDLEMITRNLSQIFTTGLSLESCITSLAKQYQKCVSKSPPDADPGAVSLMSNNAASLQILSAAWVSPPVSKGPLLPRRLLPAPQNPPPPPDTPPALETLPLENQPANPASPSDSSASEIKVEIVDEEVKGDEEPELSPQEAEERIRQALGSLCTEPAARLCLSEFAVAQKSVQLIGTNEETVNIQILEDTYAVNQRSPNSCTCHFSQTFQLPCRHILAMLNSDKKVLDLELVAEQWRKDRSVSQLGQSGSDGLFEVLKSSWDESLDKSLAVSFLTEEISRLLTQCSREEFDRRYNTLRELADSWIGPYLQVKL